MPFTPESIKAHAIPEITQRITPADCILYSLSVGIGSDPVSPAQLRYVYEDGLVANPMMANVIGYPGFWIKDEAVGADWHRVLHGEQFVELHRPIPVDATVIGRSRVVAVNDRGPDRGAFLYTRRVVSDTNSGEDICTIYQTTVARGDGGCGGNDEAPKKVTATPNRAPDMSVDSPILPQAALLYRLNGDFNPLHADPAVAEAAGYPQPILHGLCTLGVAGHAILAAACDYDASRFTGIAVRFTAPVFPGETLRTDLWKEPGGVAFRAHVLERSVQVLGHGFANVA